jgi:membrane protein
MNGFKAVLARVDSFQRRHGALGFPVAVVKKFGDDKAGQLAALIAYYGFFSLFPLLLVLVTVLGMFLSGNRELQDRIVDSAIAQFPVIGQQIRNNIHSITGSGLLLAIGLAGALWAGLGGLKAAQNAMNHVWDVPQKHHPGLPVTLLRALIMLAALGGFLIASSALASVATAERTESGMATALGLSGSLAVNVLLFAVAYKVLTVEAVSWRDVLPGAVPAGILWSALQAVGSYYVERQVASASEVYGLFAMVIGLLSWIYLGAQITLMCAELNVVRARHLWPRSLTGDDLTEADRRALLRYARVEERRPDEEVRVRFSDPQPDPSPPPAGDRGA